MMTKEQYARAMEIWSRGLSADEVTAYLVFLPQCGNALSRWASAAGTDEEAAGWAIENDNAHYLAEAEARLLA